MDVNRIAMRGWIINVLWMLTLIDEGMSEYDVDVNRIAMQSWNIPNTYPCAVDVNRIAMRG